jgi:sigma-E factor negative regulatory protein RseC
MATAPEILHEGIVETNTNGTVTVRVNPGSACAGCQAAQSCNAKVYESRSISISGSYEVEPGEKVIVAMLLSQGYNAVVLVYLIPFVLLVAALAVFSVVFRSEALTGIVSLCILIPYYFALYIFRKKIGNRYSFRIKT